MERMLIIEDDRSLYQPLQHVFEADGFHLDFAEDGAAGIEAFRKAHSSDSSCLISSFPKFTGGKFAGRSEVRPQAFLSSC